MNNKTKLIVLNGLMIALVCIATMVIQIPIPMTEGYVNIGDGIIFVASILFCTHTPYFRSRLAPELAVIP